MKKRFLLLAMVLALLPTAGWALGPHEILLLINTNAADSVRVGELYARLRKVPDANVVRLGVPIDGALTVDAFRNTIGDPVLAESKRRGVDSHILAWVYAPGFPWRVDGESTLSLTGLTFLRGVPADTNAVALGGWLSPYYAGPHVPGERGYGSRSLDVLGGWMGDGKPMAAWALAHVGPFGLTAPEAEAMLIRGVDSDATRPSGVFYVVTNADVRSTARAWQWPAVMEELGGMGFVMALTHAMPKNAGPVAGLMTGSATFDPTGILFQAGAPADHMTSFGAVFAPNGQSSCTDWLKAGATAAGGTVTEPRAFWTKFPHARLFVHVAAGCTALESYYQSIRCPLQYLPMGDPLAAPWKPRGEVTITGLDLALAGRGGPLKIGVKQTDRAVWSAYQVFVDGREIGGGYLEDPFLFEPTGLAPGAHELRVVVRTGGLLRHQIFAVRPFTTGGGGAP